MASTPTRQTRGAGHRRSRRRACELPTLDILWELVGEFLLDTPKSVLSLRPVNRELNGALGADTVWQRFYRGFRGQRIPGSVRSVEQDFYLAVKEAVLDSSRIAFHGTDELACMVFTFRFKDDAGEFWFSRDPARYGGPPMIRRFLPDGTFWSPGLDPIHGDPEINSFIPNIRWRFTKSRGGKRGQFIQVNRWPAYTITRTADFGWKLENECVEKLAAARRPSPSSSMAMR